VARLHAIGADKPQLADGPALQGLPSCSPPMSRRRHQPLGLQRGEVLPQAASIRVQPWPGVDFPWGRPAAGASKQGAPWPLAVPPGVVLGLRRRQVAVVPKMHRHAAAPLFDPRARQPGTSRRFRHLDRSLAPLLDDAATVEGRSDDRISWPRFVRRARIARGQPEVQGAGRDCLQPVVVCCKSNGSAAECVVAVAEGVRQRLPYGRGRTGWIVDASHAARLETAGDGQGLTQGSFGIRKQAPVMLSDGLSGNNPAGAPSGRP